MIAFFPKAYEDELLYSLLSRYHQRTGNARFVFTAEELYLNGKTTHPSVEFVNAYTEDAMKWLAKEKPWKAVAEEHTMFPAFVRFLPLGRRKVAEEGVRRCNGNWKNIMCLPVLGEKRYLRYCPECAKEDRREHGETYWHREHQIPRIRICPKHHMFLENCKIPIASKTSPGLFNAQDNVPENTISRVVENSREVEFTQYVLDLFREPIDLKTDYLIGAFLHSKLQNQYKNKSGIVRNMARLYDDYISFYAGMPQMTQTYMQKIFNGYMFDVYYILQLAFFEGISVYDITHIPPTTQSDEYDALYKQLAEKHRVDYDVVSNIATEVLKHANKRVSIKSGPKRREYGKLDRELLPKVKKTVQEILNKDGRPERVTVTKIQRLMELPQKQFNKLPRCLEYIQKHTETQEEFWVRQVNWAVRDIENGGGMVTMSKIMKLTNIRKDNVERCWPLQKF